MTAWRWRRCPGCGSVNRAGDLITHFEPRHDEPWSRGDVERECPDCGYRGPTYEFEVVRERHPAGSTR